MSQAPVSTASTASSAQPIIDFTELPDTAPKGEKFELLMRELLRVLGFETAWSGRGADGGRDITAVETLQSVAFPTKRVWLVSCKHFAHSGRSVTPEDTLSIVERCEQHNACGFLLCCTTVPSSGLVAMMEGINSKIVSCWDHARIAEILTRPEAHEVLRQFLPQSYTRLKKLQPIDTLLEKLKDVGIGDVGMGRIRAIIREELSEAEQAVPSAEMIFPKSEQAKLIDAAVAAFVVRKDIAECGKVLSALNQGEWLSTVDVLNGIDPELTSKLLEQIARTDSSKARKLDAVQLLIDEHSYNLLGVADFLDGLDSRDTETILEQFDVPTKVEEAVSQYLMENGHQELDSLGQYTTIEEVVVDDLEYSFWDGTIYVDGSISVSCEVCGGGGPEMDGVAFPCSFPGDFNGEVDPDGIAVQVTEIKIDNSSFYDNTDDDDDVTKLPIPGDKS